MLKLTSALMVLLALAAMAHGQATQPAAIAASAPAVKPGECKALVALARTAMAEFLLRRTPADKQTPPGELSGLAGKAYPAAVTLRQGGKVVARCVRAGDDVRRNVIAAALEAMRSPDLPDHVTADVLAGLRVEVEVISQGDQLPAASVDAFAPGRTGLRASLGDQDSWVLPSEAYLQNLQLAQMVSLCDLQLPRQRAADAKVTWRMLAGQLYVSYPNGPTLWLFRGKSITPPELIDPEQLAAAGNAIVAYLVSRQAADGRFVEADGQGANPADQLFVAYALARIGRQGGKAALRAAGLAIDQAAKAIETKDGRTYIATPNPNQQTLATSMYVVAANQLAKPSASAGAMRQTLIDAISGADTLPARLDGAVQGPSGPVRTAMLREMYIAARAMREPSPAPAATATSEPASRPASSPAAVAEFIDRLERTDAMTADAAAVKAWAGLNLTAADLGTLVQAGDALPDETGGFSDGKMGPGTVLTAMMVRRLAQRPADAENALAARRFCWQMTVKAFESYNMDMPQELVGAVHLSPSSSITSLFSAAAAAEALLDAPRE